MATGKEYADGLRAIADWYEAHPEAPQPHTPLQVFTPHTKEEAIQIARWLGHADKRYDNGLFYLSRDFGGATLVFVWSQSAVCTRHVVGTVEEPEQVRPAYTREVVMWDCHPLLASEPAGA